MPTVIAPDVKTYTLDALNALTVTADAVSSGTVVRLGDSAGAAARSVNSLLTGETRTFGPFGVQTTWQIIPTAGALTVTTAFPDLLTTSSGVRVAHARYSFALDGGAQSTIAPVNSDTIPDNAILVGATINSTTAAAGATATIAVGTSAGSSTTSIKGATAVTSYSSDAVLNGVPTFASPVKMTAAGTITFTIATANLTAGIIEVWVYYVVAAA